MGTIHRYDSKERTHYLFNNKYKLLLKPELVYAGTLKKSKGWIDEAHSHPFPEIVLITEGKGSVFIEGKEYKAQKKDLIIYNKGVRHFEKSSKDFPFELTFIAINKVQLTDMEINMLIPPEFSPVYHTNGDYEKILACFNNIVSEAINKEDFYYDVSKYYSRILILEIFRIIKNRQPSLVIVKQNEALENAVKYIESNFTENITLDDIAKSCYINKYYLSHIFKEHFGCSVKDYIIKKRIDTAKFIICQNTLSISAIAELVGIPDCNYFCRLFKKREKMTPLEYKKSQCNQDNNN